MRIVRMYAFIAPMNAKMPLFILTRLAAMVPTAVLVLALVGALIHTIPGDPVDSLLGEHAALADRDALRTALGLDRPVALQIYDFAAGALQGDWGQSLANAKPVLGLIAERLPATGWLAAAAMGVALTLGTLMGIAGALAARPVRASLDLVTLAVMATPSFVLGPLLIASVAVGLNLLPVSGMQGPESIILPALTLGAGLAAVIARFLTESLNRAMAADHVRTAVAKGAPMRRVLWRHAMPVALLPVVQIVFLQLGMVLTGAVLTEAVFGWPGLGNLLLDALHGRDYPLMQGCLLLISLVYMLCVLLSDVVVAWLDPRVGA